MKTVYKYSFSHPGIGTSISMPIDSEILSLQMQHGIPCLWVLVDTDKAPCLRQFYIYGTGHEIPSTTQKFIGTFQVSEGNLVFHVFEDL